MARSLRAAPPVRRCTRLTIAVTLLTAIGLGAPAGAAPSRDGGELRAFAVAYRHHVDRVESYATFEASVRDQFDAQIAPHLATQRPNLVTYPEDQGLMAYMIGARGAHARQLMRGGAGAAESLASLAATYAPQMAYYEAKFPGTDSPGQLLLLALTDVSGRAIVETFSRLAADHGVYVTVSTNVAEFERVEGPQAASLGDPEADGSYAYEATSPEVHNRNFVFGPDGELIDIQSKAYLVPIERSRDLGLGMTGVQIDELAVIDLPFGRLGTVTSKDAWMVDVNERLDQRSATLLVQPEAFSTWAVPGGDLWPPDKFQRSGWLMTQRHPALRANVTPMLTGNFGDMTFDGQPLIAVETPGGIPGLCNLGQRPEPGWAAIGRWNATEEPAQELCGEHRREEFAERGEAMRPGSGDEHENAYAEDVVFADLDLSLPRPAADRVARGDFAVTEPAPGQASQLVPSVTATVDGAALTWIDLRRGNSSTYAVRFDGGAWSVPALVSDQGVHEHDHFDNQWSPVIARTGEGLVASFLDFRTENWDLYRSTSSDGSSWSGNERVDDADEVEGTIRERGHSSPALARLSDGRLISVWSDLRWPFVVPQVRAAVSDDSGSTWSPSVRLDGGAEAQEDVQPWARHPAEAPGHGQHAPAVTVTGDGGILVAWQNGAGSVPHVQVVRSPDGGRSFSAPVELGVGPGFRPALAAEGDDVWLAYERRTDDGGSVIELAHSHDGGAGWSEPVTADPAPPVGVTQRNPALVAANGTIGVVFSDDRAGDEDVLLAVTDGAANQPSRLYRLDDGADGSHARAPSVTLLDDGRVLAVWQEEEDGSTVGLRAAVGRLPRVGAPGAAPTDERPTLPASGGGLALAAVVLMVAARCISSRGAACGTGRGTA